MEKLIWKYMAFALAPLLGWLALLLIHKKGGELACYLATACALNQK